jgi:hypothetical protein
MMMATSARDMKMGMLAARKIPNSAKINAVMISLITRPGVPAPLGGEQGFGPGNHL